jgi:hypothetical protein
MLAFLVSVVAAPAYASDDSPGLLDSVEKTVDSLTAPSTSSADAPTSAGPVTQLTTIVDSAVGGQTSLSDLSLVSTVDDVLSGSAVVPTAPAPETEGPAEGDDSSLVEPTASVAGDDQVLASQPLAAVLQLDSFSASEPSTAKKDAESAHIPGTSTLPDGGSPLTLAWLVLWFGVTAAGALVLRRART